MPEDVTFLDGSSLVSHPTRCFVNCVPRKSAALRALRSHLNRVHRTNESLIFTSTLSIAQQCVSIMYQRAELLLQAARDDYLSQPETRALLERMIADLPTDLDRKRKR